MSEHCDMQSSRVAESARPETNLAGKARGAEAFGTKGIRKTWRVEGMHCPRCEAAVRRALAGAAGISEVEVSIEKGTLSALWDAKLLPEAEIDARLREAGYGLVRGSSRAEWLGDVLRLLAALAVAGLFYLLLTRTVVADWTRAFPTAREGMGLGALFAVGLATSLHCVAMCGGINLAQSAASAQRGAKPTRANLLYNLGRLCSYTLIGGIVGALGTALSITHTAKAAIQIIAAVFMLLMALNLLGSFSWLRKLTPHLPNGLIARLFGLLAGKSFASNRAKDSSTTLSGQNTGESSPASDLAESERAEVVECRAEMPSFSNGQAEDSSTPLSEQSARKSSSAGGHAEGERTEAAGRCSGKSSFAARLANSSSSPASDLAEGERAKVTERRAGKSSFSTRLADGSSSPASGHAEGERAEVAERRTGKSSFAARLADGSSSSASELAEDKRAEVAERRTGKSSFAIGLANGLMPCGPLQAMQLYALSAGSWWRGALSMFCFCLGTIPLMLGVGLVSGKLNRRFAKPMRYASAALVLAMGVSALASGLALAGVNVQGAVPAQLRVVSSSTAGQASSGDAQSVNIAQPGVTSSSSAEQASSEDAQGSDITQPGLASSSSVEQASSADAQGVDITQPGVVSSDPAEQASSSDAQGVVTTQPGGEIAQPGVAIVRDGVQYVRSELEYGGYPVITVRAGIPVEWTIHAEESRINSCNREIYIPKFDLSVPLEPGDNLVRFTPEEEGTIPYTCWMGMIRSAIYVTAGPAG